MKAESEAVDHIKKKDGKSQNSRRRPRDLSEVKSKLSAEMKQKGDKTSSPVLEFNPHQPARRRLIQDSDEDDGINEVIGEGDQDDKEEQNGMTEDEGSSSDEGGSKRKSDSGEGSSEGEGDNGERGYDFYQTTFAPTRHNLALVIEARNLEAFVTGLLKDWQYCNRPTVSSDVHLVATTTKKFVSGCRQVYVSGCLASNADDVGRLCLALKGMCDEFTKCRGEDNREAQGIRGWLTAMIGEQLVF